MSLSPSLIYLPFHPLNSHFIVLRDARVEDAAHVPWSLAVHDHVVAVGLGTGAVEVWDLYSEECTVLPPTESDATVSCNRFATVIFFSNTHSLCCPKYLNGVLWRGDEALVSFSSSFKLL